MILFGLSLFPFIDHVGMREKVGETTFLLKGYIDGLYIRLDVCLASASFVLPV